MPERKSHPTAYNSMVCAAVSEPVLNSPNGVMALGNPSKRFDALL